MPLSVRSLSEIRCVGSVLIAIMDQGSEVECSWILPEIITRNRHGLTEVYVMYSVISSMFITTNSDLGSFAKGLLDTHFYETYSFSFAV